MACVLTLACWAVPGAAQRSAAGVDTAGVRAEGRASVRDVRDLRDVFATGWLLQDRNADDVVDFVHARIVLPAAAQEADVAGAANVAARLGYETSATDLGLAVHDSVVRGPLDAPAILLGGARNAVATRAGAAAAAHPLAPGEGAIGFVPPNGVLRAGAVTIDGYDATGQLAAAGYFAGRYPSVWGMRGATYAQLAERIARFLAETGVEGADVTIHRIVVAAGRPGVTRVLAGVRVPDSAAFARALAALEPPATRDTAAADSAATAARDTAVADSAARARADTARAGGRGRTRLADLVVADLHRLDIELSADGRSRTVRLLPLRPWTTRAGSEFTARDAPDFTLSDLYTIRGLFRDTNQDLVPDRTEAWISLHGGAAAAAAVDLAQRIGLETAGMRLPLVGVGGQDDRPHDDGFPIVFGVGHYQTDRLQREGRLFGLTAGPGVGFVQLAPRAFGGRPGLVIGGQDARGLDAASRYVSHRMPYLWDHGKGNVELADVETEVRRFFQLREAPGQIAFALVKLGQWLDRLAAGGGALDSIGVELAARDAPSGLDREIERRVRARFPGAAVTAAAHATGFGVGKQIFVQDTTFPWEVDEARAALQREILPRISASSRGRIEVRVSEPPEVRAALAREIREAVGRRGAASDAFDVVVISAYKQGYGWVEDVVLPKLRGRGVARIEIAYHSLRDSKEVRWQTVESETRWLQELYPIDAILARELAIPDSAITFAPRTERFPIYTLRAFDDGGAEIARESFDPKYVIRPFFDLFPEYEQVRVTTGWITATTGTDTLVDRRIRTDPETFWDFLQTQTYRRIIDYVMDVQEGRPSPANAPYFDELRVDLTLSEPDHRIGVDEEVISSLEALHEDIYFETLTLFDLIGDRYGVGSLAYAGRVLPWIHDGAGKPGRARISLTGKERAAPALVMTHRERGRDAVRQRYALTALPVPAPKLRGVSVRAGDDRVAQLLFEVAAIDSLDRWQEYRERSTEEGIDRTFLAVPVLEGMLRALGELHAAGMLTGALSLDRVDELAFRFTLDDTTRTFSRLATLPRSARPRATRNPDLYADGWEHDGRRIVQWRTPIPPSENDSILAKLATFPGVDVYFITNSFLGQPVWAADFLPPHDAAFVSQAKLNALKPTLLLSGRQHANEVSSTSHILRLGELLVTDTAYASLLRKVNVVLHPITNPDGARLAYEMQLENPDFMLHAGYLGALGVDATSGAATDDPIYPESKARPELQQAWLPDIFINMHGYPSHEWIQYFAGYSAWVRSRSGAQRSWWSPRGWFIPGFSWVHDDRYPELEKAQFAILDSVAAAITGQPEVEAMNRRLYQRYRKYGKQDVENFREYFHKGVLVYSALRGRDAAGTGVNSPRVTYFSITTEAPDETARGNWLELVATAGLAHGSALLRYLASGQNRLERESAEFADFVTRTVFRKKPVLPR
jgi:hypothetical protein